MNPMRALTLMLGWMLIALLALAGPVQAQPAEPDGQPSANAALADLLENEQSRQQLIDQLRGAADAAAVESPPAEEAQLSLPRQLAEITSHVASDCLLYTSPSPRD